MHHPLEMLVISIAHILPGISHAKVKYHNQMQHKSPVTWLLRQPVVSGAAVPVRAQAMKQQSVLMSKAGAIKAAEHLNFQCGRLCICAGDGAAEHLNLQGGHRDVVAGALQRDGGRQPHRRPLRLLAHVRRERGAHRPHPFTVWGCTSIATHRPASSRP